MQLLLGLTMAATAIVSAVAFDRGDIGMSVLLALVAVCCLIYSLVLGEA